jgi:hypothetical protein
MARLSISLLGPFHVTLDGRSVTHFESAKVRGLLAFLAADAARLHTRDALAELFSLSQQRHFNSIPLPMQSSTSLDS